MHVFVGLLVHPSVLCVALLRVSTDEGSFNQIPYVVM
jgi:hypothetical protein